MYKALKNLYNRHCDYGPRLGNSEDKKSYCMLFARITKSQYLMVPTYQPPLVALLAVKRLRAEAAAVFANEFSDMVLNRLAPHQQLLPTRHSHENVKIYDSFQSLINQPMIELPRRSYMCLLRKERMVMLWGFSIGHLESLLEESTSMLSIHVGASPSLQKEYCMTDLA